MNVIYMHSHDTGRYIQPYGHAVDTPHMQRFAEEGVLFRKAYCAGPTCSPSRAALLTGQAAHSCGMLGLSGRRKCRLNDYSQHLSHFLKNHGYTTVLSGLQHEAPGEEVRDLLGYDRYLDDHWPEGTDTFLKWNQLYAQNAVDFLKDYSDNKPFFLSVGFSLTHRMGEGEQWHTTDCPPEGDPRYVLPPAPLPDTPEVRKDFADFHVAVHHLDACMGVVLDGLEAAGLSDDTLVIITTDHGIAYPLMKCNLTEHGTGVMLLMRGPGGFTGGQVIDALVSHVDIFPTICEGADISVPEFAQGTPIQPLVNGESDHIHEYVFSEVNWHGLAEPMRTVRDERYRYIRKYVIRQGSDNCDNSITKTQLRNNGWDDRHLVEENLYDSMFDPNEAGNLAESPEYSEVKQRLATALNQWMADTNDPVLTGRIDPCPGMQVVRDRKTNESIDAEPILL